MRNGSIPTHVWLVLGVAICGVSSAGAIFTHVDEIPPLLRASWRLQLTALLLAPLALWQFSNTQSEIRSKLVEPTTVKIVVASGAFLALHFGFWVTSLDYTSLTHSLLFVTAHPLVILIGMFSLYANQTDWSFLEELQHLLVLPSPCSTQGMYRVIVL